jgi:hypothetical protein
VNRDQVYASRHFAGRVKRYHTWPTLHQQTVAEHCWRVAGILVEIFGMPRAEVLFYCLHHDSGELWAGDLPFGTKKTVAGLKDCMNKAEEIGLHNLGIKLPELTTSELAQVKICDLLEMHEFGKAEIDMGNKCAFPIIKDTLYLVQRLAGEHCFSEKVNKWLELNGGSQWT